MAQLAGVCARASVPNLPCMSLVGDKRGLIFRIGAQWPQTFCKAHLSSSSDHIPSSANCRTVCHAAPDVTTQDLSDVQQVPEDDWLQRSRLLVGADGLAKLAAVNVLLVGLGGVGSFAAEFLCRAGVGRMTIVDGDTIDTTNRNRQLPALKSTVGLLKAEVVAGRLQDINSDIQLTVKQEFLDPVRAAVLVQEQQYHYVVDCIDSVAPKQALLLAGHQSGCKVVSSMGAGGRLDPSRVQLADISDTYNDAFAAVVRRGLRKAGVSHGVTVVFSDELAKPASLALTQQQYKKSYFGTSSYIPAIFGLYIASHIIRDVVEDGYAVPAGAAAANRAQRKSTKRNSGNGRTSKMKSSRQSKQQQQQQQQEFGQLKLSAVDSCTAILQQQPSKAQQQQQQQQPSMADDANNHPCSRTDMGPNAVPSADKMQDFGTAAAVSVGDEVPGKSVRMAHPQQQSSVPESELSDAASFKQQESVQTNRQDVRHVLRSFEQSKGVGAGFDGYGI